MCIYLIGSQSDTLQTINKSLAADGLQCVVKDVFDLDKKNRAVYVIMPGVRFNEGELDLPAISKEARDFRIFCNDPVFPSLLGASLLSLPQATHPQRVYIIAKWVYDVCGVLSVTKQEIIRLMYPNMSLVEKTELLTREKRLLTRQALELENALRELDFQNSKIIEELSLAGELQKSFLPKEYPVDLPLDFAQKYIPCEFIGGDLFEVIRLDEHTVGIIIADVSGHGVAAALLTAMFKSAFHHYSEGCFSPAETLEKIHNEFLETIHTEHFVTAFYAVIDTEAMCCRYCNAGHPRQMLLRKNGRLRELSATGLFIGMLEEATFKERKFMLYPGDRLFFYTDGIIECKNGQGRPFGRENLRKIIKNGADSNILMVSNNIIQELMSYIAELRFSDDISLLITEIIESI